MFLNCLVLSCLDVWSIYNYTIFKKVTKKLINKKNVKIFG